MREPRSPQDPEHRLPSTGQRTDRTNQQIVSVSPQSTVLHIGRAHPVLPFFIPQYSSSSHQGQTGTDDAWARVAASTIGEYTARMINILRTTHDLARQHLKTYQEAEIRVHDQLRLGAPFQVGDSVWLHQELPPRGSPSKFYHP